LSPFETSQSWFLNVSRLLDFQLIWGDEVKWKREAYSMRLLFIIYRTHLRRWIQFFSFLFVSWVRSVSE
jgi:hypothetical protein